MFDLLIWRPLAPRRRLSLPLVAASAGPAAAGAMAPKINAIILNLKIVGFDIGPANAVEERGFDIGDAPAFQADQMMVLMHLWVKARRRTGVTGFGDEAKRDECPQNAMDRHARDLRQPSPDRAIKLLGGGMVGAVLDCFKDGAPLGGDRQAALAVGGEKAVYSFLFFCLSHYSEMNICTR